MSNIASTLQRILTAHGDLTKPVPPGAIFASLPSAEEFKADKALAGMKYPPLVSDGSNCLFEPGDRTLQSTVWGRVIFSNDGIRIKPAWKMSSDKMLLSLEVNHVDFAGEAMTTERIQSYTPKALEEVVVDMDFSGVSEALEESARTGQPVVTPIARGSLPEEGRDAYLDLVFSSGQSAGKLREDGTMDFRERASLHSVAEGEPLGKLFPAVNGKFGQDLFGNPIDPGTVLKAKVNVGQGVEAMLGDDGVVTYTASRTGVARFRNEVLEVVELLEIPGDVDFSTGNIYAEHGSIHIKGDVKCGFVVESSGDVVIDGVVEEADIVAGGLVIAGGVIMNGKNSIRAKGDVSAHFFRNALIEADGDVSADQELSNCTVTAGGKVELLGGKGIISGGHIISAQSIRASIIGNKSCVDTCVEIRLPDSIRDKLVAARKQFEEELADLDKAIGVDFDLSKLMSAPEEDRRILAELIKVRARIQGEIRDIKETMESLQEEAQRDSISKRIVAEKIAYCGTKAIISGKGHRLTKNLQSPGFYLDVESQQIAWD